eukprot:5056677-Ditylum_brightwellii.AAC.1
MGLNPVISGFGVSCCYFERGSSNTINECIQMPLQQATDYLSQCSLPANISLQPSFVTTMFCKKHTQRAACVPPLHDGTTN